MRLKELNCKNCGATLEVEENATQVKCKFCNTTFAVEDAYTDGYKFEKGKLQAQSEHFAKSMEQVNDFLNNNPIAKIHKKMSIIITIIFVVIFVMALIGIISTSVSQNKMRDKINDDSIINDMNDYMSDFKQLDYGMRSKMENCDKCIMNKICMGVWKEHFEEFSNMRIHAIV